MTELKIVGWTDFESPYKTKRCNVEEIEQMMALLRTEIAEHGYVFSGEEHQNATTGVPVFSDGTCLRASMRAWGSLMASMYSGADGQELSYMDFYMSLGNSAVLPPCKEIAVAPAAVEAESSGLTVKADRELVDQAIALDMEFMTSDKVLKKIYKKMKYGK